MGFNTVAFVLNDMMGELERAPKTLAYALSHPFLSKDHQYDRDQLLCRVASEAGERWNHQALTMLPSWHADGFKFLVAGRNTIEELKWLKGGRGKGSKTVTLQLPDWWHR